MSCDDCTKWVASVAQAVAIAGKSFPTYEEASAVLQEISCVFLPPPFNIGCVLAITEEAAGYVLVAQFTRVIE